MTDVETGRRGPAGWLPARSFGLKLLLVCLLALMMAIPALVIFALVYDRSERARTAQAGIGALAGGPQVLVGPILAVPFEIPSRAAGLAPETGLYVVSPETGQANAKVKVTTRRRSLYAAQVYDATVGFKAAFVLPETAERLPPDARIDWGSARLVMALSDLRGVKNEVSATLADGARLRFEPVGQLSAVAGSAKGARGYDEYYGDQPGQWVAASLGGRASPGGRLNVESELVLTGAERLAFAPFARQTSAKMSADWPDPSLDGAYLAESRDIRADGFDASWAVSSLARGAPGEARLEDAGFGQMASRTFGTSFVDAGDPYRNVTRSLKYALMFIGFVFLGFFMFEAASGERVHAAQYVLVGLAQAVFYVLLLALAEYVGVDWAFLAAGGATVALTAWFAGQAFGGHKHALRGFLVFGLVYLLLYGLMRLEDYALLIGAGASFVMLTVTMWVTRKVDWYGRAGA